MLEIRWHSRAGQGAVTGAKGLSDVMAAEGKFVQAFSVYGAEKRGAPMNSFNRVADEKIIDHSKTMMPDYVLVIDPSLAFGDITYDTKESTKYIISTHLSKEELIEKAPALKGKEGALMKVSGLFTIDDFKKGITKVLSKFPQKIIDGNLTAIQTAYDEVK
jgi:pyruvate ferredoxin oxidoreductase gamma subunit